MIHRNSIFRKGDILVGCHEENEGICGVYMGVPYGRHKVLIKNYSLKLLDMSRISYSFKAKNPEWSCYSPLVLKKFWRKKSEFKIDNDGNLN